MRHDKYALFTIKDWDDFWEAVRVWKHFHSWDKIVEHFTAKERIYDNWRNGKSS
jgi:hypothetical protein